MSPTDRQQASPHLSPSRLYAGYAAAYRTNTEVKAPAATWATAGYAQWPNWLNPLEKFAAAPAGIPMQNLNAAGWVHGLLHSRRSSEDLWS